MENQRLLPLDTRHAPVGAAQPKPDKNNIILARLAAENPAVLLLVRKFGLKVTGVAENLPI